MWESIALAKVWLFHIMHVYWTSLFATPYRFDLGYHIYNHSPNLQNIFRNMKNAESTELPMLVWSTLMWNSSQSAKGIQTSKRNTTYEMIPVSCPTYPGTSYKSVHTFYCVTLLQDRQTKGNHYMIFAFGRGAETSVQRTLSIIISEPCFGIMLNLN